MAKKLRKLGTAKKRGKVDFHDLDHLRGTPHMVPVFIIGMLALAVIILGADALGWG